MSHGPGVTRVVDSEKNTMIHNAGVDVIMRLINYTLSFLKQLVAMSLRPDSGSGSSLETRKKNYKIGIDAEEGRRRREEDLVGIRKNKREDTLNKKRNQTHAAHSCDTLLEVIPAMVQRLCSQYPAAQLEATAYFKTLLSLDRHHHPPIDDILKEGILPCFLEFLSRDDAPQLQLEALWVLTNVSSGTSQHVRLLVQLGLVPSLVNLLTSTNNDDIKEETVSALGNIAGDSPSCRDLVLNHGALFPLLHQLETSSRLSMLKLATCCLSNLVRGKPPVNFEQVKSALPVLHGLIHSTDEEVVTDACWALSSLSGGSINNIQAIIELGVSPKLIEILQCSSDTVILPALQTLGNIVYGDDAQTQHVIDMQLLPRLHHLLTHAHRKSVIKEACWTISNITAGNIAQIQAVINANIIPPLVDFLLHAELEIKEEVAWAICNMTRGSREHIRYVAAQGCINGLCKLLTCPDPNVVAVCLEGLENILVVGEADKEMGLHDRGNIFAQRIDECGGWDKFDILQIHENNDISERAVRILKTFWPENDLEDVTHFQNATDGSQQDFSSSLNQPHLPPRGFHF
ncbi:hypothetical protein VNO78_18277 [Psophocarpus tetragonolobus]|uniref:Importin subunit alpha n=1 Tax=Psophocarpus tetragonolobus TaxID=3891 RepID=A0AAN9XLP6_PSOTE